MYKRLLTILRGIYLVLSVTLILVVINIGVHRAIAEQSFLIWCYIGVFITSAVFMVASVFVSDDPAAK